MYPLYCCPINTKLVGCHTAMLSCATQQRLKWTRPLDGALTLFLTAPSAAAVCWSCGLRSRAETEFVCNDTVLSTWPSQNNSPDIFLIQKNKNKNYYIISSRLIPDLFNVNRMNLRQIHKTRPIPVSAPGTSVRLSITLGHVVQQRLVGNKRPNNSIP